MDVAPQINIPCHVGFKDYSKEGIRDLCVTGMFTGTAQKEHFST